MAIDIKQLNLSLNRLIDDLIQQSDSLHPVWNIEKIRTNGKNRWNYVDGCMISAFLQLFEVTKDSKFLNFSDQFMDWFVQNDGSIKTLDVSAKCLDDVCGARTFFPLFELTGRVKYRNAIDSMHLFLRNCPRTHLGNFWHKLVYPNQVWLDGAYMAMPFYMEYETKCNNMRNYYDIYSQLMGLQKYLRNSETGLYYHGFDESRKMDWADPETGCSKSFWLRSIGWLAMALVDTLEKMDEQIYYEYRCIQAMLKNLLDSLLPYQDGSGMFYQVVDRPMDQNNYLETSGTCMIACAIMKAVRLHFISGRYWQFGEKAFTGTVNQYFAIKNNKPILGGICLVGGLGGQQMRNGTPEYYYSEPTAENEGKGLAPFLLAYSELLRKDTKS